MAMMDRRGQNEADALKDKSPGREASPRLGLSPLLPFDPRVPEAAPCPQAHCCCSPPHGPAWAGGGGVIPGHADLRIPPVLFEDFPGARAWPE